MKKIYLTNRAVLINEENWDEIGEFDGCDYTCHPDSFQHFSRFTVLRHIVRKKFLVLGKNYTYFSRSEGLAQCGHLDRAGESVTGNMSDVRAALKRVCEQIESVDGLTEILHDLPPA